MKDKYFGIWEKGFTKMMFNTRGWKNFLCGSEFVSDWLSWYFSLLFAWIIIGFGVLFINST